MEYKIVYLITLIEDGIVISSWKEHGESEDSVYENNRKKYPLSEHPNLAINVMPCIKVTVVNLNII